MKLAIVEYLLISRSGLFDDQFYLQRNPDVRRADVDPIMHFIHSGWKEYRDPSPNFSIQYYLDNNPDVKASGTNPLIHFIRFGKRERRLAVPPSAKVQTTGTQIGVSEKGGFGYPKRVRMRKLDHPDVSVIIPTRNGGKLFEQTLTSLIHQVYAGKIEIVVIDTESEDGTPALAKKHGAKVIPIAKAEFNHGLTRNRAAEYTSGEVLAFLSQDAIPGNEQYIDHLTAAFSDPLVAGAYARQVPRENADIFTRRDLNNWLTGRLEPEVRWIKDFDAYLKLSPVDKYIFCNFDDVASAMSRSVWQAIPFNRNEFGEDIEWSMNALEAGWRIAYVPDAFVVHSHLKSFKYEYSRSVLTHRKLYDQFGLWTIPSLKAAQRCIRQGISAERMYAREHINDQKELKRVLSQVPALVISGVAGQYQGARLARNIQAKQGKK